MPLIGLRVIVKTNEDDPPTIGRIKAMQLMGKRTPCLVPLVTEEDTGEDYLCLAAIAPYSDELWESLKGLDPKEQHERVCVSHCLTPQWREQQRNNLKNLATCQIKIDKYELQHALTPKWRWVRRKELEKRLGYWYLQERTWLRKAKGTW